MADAQDNLTTIQVGGITSIDEALGWFAHTVYVENYTNQYVSLPDVVSFIPPYTARLLALPGVQKAKMLFAAPPGTKQVASIATQVCNATWSERSVPVTGGPIGPVGVVANYYDRNPTSFALAFSQQSIAPHAATSRTSYTAPANRKAFIEIAECIVVFEAAGDTALGSVQSNLNITPVGGSPITIAAAYAQGAAPLRTFSAFALGASIEMQTGDVLQGFTANGYNATLCTHIIKVKGTEFDA